MAGIPHTFANQTAPTMDELDVDFAFVAALGIAPCTISGTNALALAPTAQSVSITGYQNFALYTGVIAADSTGLVTANVNGLGALPVELPSGVQAGAGTFTAGDFVIFAYNSATPSLVVVSAPAIGSPSLLLDQLGSTQGDILYRGASGWVALAPGTTGQVLQTKGAAANPVWATPGGTGTGGYSAVEVSASGAVAIGTLFPTATAITSFRISCCGGGAGGGGCDTTSGAKAGGGGPGNTAIAVVQGINGLSLTATIGALGAGGANTGGTGSNGGDTTLAYSNSGNSVSVVGKGGTGGTGSTSATGFTPGGEAGIAGGASAAGIITLVTTIQTLGGSANGAPGLCGTGTAGISGSGGSSLFGLGGLGTTGAGANAALGKGAGGGGASDSTGAAQVGGAGTAGLILIEAWGL